MAEIRTILKAAVKYIQTRQPILSAEQKEAGSELKRRLKRLDGDYNRLMNINNILMDSELPKMNFDESTDTMTINFKGIGQAIKLKRADPNIPIKKGTSSSIGGYLAGAPSQNSSTHTEELKMDLERGLEQYYENAFRITELVRQVAGKKRYDCRDITIVRNKLIKHPDPGSLYSFGFSSDGPVVKPIQRGVRTWNDQGLVPNTSALMESLKKIFNESA